MRNPVSPWQLDFSSRSIWMQMSAEKSRKHRAEGFDAIAAVEVEQTEFSDKEHLEYAIRQQRAIVTHNSDDFARLFDEYWRAGKEHYGIIVSEQLPVGVMMRRLLNLLDSVTVDEMRNSFRNLGEFK